MLAFYMAFFLYEDEQGRWQNRLDAFWISIHDRALVVGSTTTALWNRVSESILELTNKLFGGKLLSYRPVIASINISIAVSQFLGLLAMPLMVHELPKSRGFWLAAAVAIGQVCYAGLSIWFALRPIYKKQVEW